MDDLPPPLEIEELEEEESSHKEEKEDVAMIDEMMKAASIAKQKKEKERGRVSVFFRTFLDIYYLHFNISWHIASTKRR